MHRQAGIKRIEHAELELARAKEYAEEIKETIRNRFAFEPGKDGAPMYMLEIESFHGNDDLYVIKDFHDLIVIFLNDTTPFFEQVYEAAALKTGEEKSILDLMLFPSLLLRPTDFTRRRRKISGKRQEPRYHASPIF